MMPGAQRRTQVADEARLREICAGIGEMAIAVSGGVDSMTLASLAWRELGRGRVRMVHATSPAVPAEAGRRVRHQAAVEGWPLTVVDAGEFGDERYRANPLDRCFYCKSNLYRTLRGLGPATVCSGTNTDDLGDYRPGLAAAAEQGVRHPYVEAGFAKADVRALARRLGLPEIAALPASPCLASRVETGLRIDPLDLALVDRVEGWMRSRVQAPAVRCRVRRAGLVIEIDARSLARLLPEERRTLLAGVRAAIPELDGTALRLAEYARGSAYRRAGPGAS